MRGDSDDDGRDAASAQTSYKSEGNQGSRAAPHDRPRFRLHGHDRRALSPILLRHATLRYSSKVMLDVCCNHREIPAEGEFHRLSVGNLVRADALLFGLVTFEMMEAA